MLNNKYLLTALILCLTGINATNAETLSELDFPKPPAYRVGISELPEKQYIQAKQDKINIEKNHTQLGENSDTSSVTDMTYADLSIKRLSREVAQELEFEEQDMVADLSLLWQGAAMQSDTINFALYKLANPDADKPDSKSIKKVLTTIASMSTLVGASMANPIFAGSSLIGGNILNIMSQDTKALNYKYTRVNDADMIILIRKVEDLQQNAVNLYYDYMTAKKQLDRTTKLVEERQKKFELAQQNNAPRELVVITDAYYRTALDKQRTAKSDFFSKRAALEQFVGNETFVQFESELNARESGEKTSPKAEVKSTEATEDTVSTDPSYSETIKNVENYTKTLNSTAESENIQTQTDITGIQEEQPRPEAISDIPSLRPLPETDDNIKPIENNQKVQKNTKKEHLSIKSKLNDRIAMLSDKVDSLKMARAEKKDNADIKATEPQKSENVKKEKVKKEKTEKVKPEKNSTKGFIFLHNKDEQKQSESSAIDSGNTVPANTNTNKNQKMKDSGLLPLDEIRVPDLDGKGYSIHSEYDFGEINL